MKKIIFVVILSIFSINLYANTDWAERYDDGYICNIGTKETLKSSAKIKATLQYYGGSKNLKVTSEVFEDIGGYLALEATDVKDKYRMIASNSYIVFDRNTKVFEIKSTDTKKTLNQLLITDCINTNDLN